MKTFRVATNVMQDLINKAKKGAGNIPQLPITKTVEFDLTDGVLTLSTTDEVNHLKVYSPGVAGDNVKFIVLIDIISNLILKITTEYIDFEVEDAHLKVKADGDYVIELFVDDQEEEMAAFPQPHTMNEVGVEIETLASSEFNTSCVPILLGCKQFLAAQKSISSDATRYYVTNEAITSAGLECVCNVKYKGFPMTTLIPVELAQLMQILPGNSTAFIQIWNMTDNGYKTCRCHVYCDGIDIYGVLPNDELDTYPLGLVEQILDNQYEYQCVLNKNQLLSAISRISLFINPAGFRNVYFTFDNTGVILSVPGNNSSEKIKYFEGGPNKIGTNYQIVVPLNVLINSLNFIDEDNCLIRYGNDSCICVQSGQTKLCIAILSDEE